MSSPAVTSSSFFRIAQVLAWALTITIVVLTIVPPFLRPVTGAPHNFEHFVMFLLAGAAFSLGYPRRELILCASAILFSGILELLQLSAPGRHARISDFVVDALGACAGVVFGSLLVSQRSRSADMK